MRALTVIGDYMIKMHLTNIVSLRLVIKLFCSENAKPTDIRMKMSRFSTFPRLCVTEGTILSWQIVARCFTLHCFDHSDDSNHINLL